VDKIDGILAQWMSNPEYSQTFAAVHTSPGREGKYSELPPDLPEAVRLMLKQAGINQLYAHQQACWDALKMGLNPVLTTSTSSGKSLCYQLPIISHFINQSDSRALMIFPTKALSYDQLVSFQSLTKFLPPESIPSSAVYDGDTPASSRSSIRNSSRVIITNPDMLHTAILPHHTKWEDVFRNLCYVVLDEIHTYRGIFGSHVANVIRRMQRICAFYGSYPLFIMTSATIANPEELGSKLVGRSVLGIHEDGSPQGKKTFIICNPPLVNKEFGIRRSAFSQSVIIAQDLQEFQAQTILFCGTRKAVENSVIFLRQHSKLAENAIRGYRSGYLPKERREIEVSLRSGEVRIVAATNALELGLDIGGLDASVMMGYPGTIASSRQQAGRAGRRNESSIAILVSSSRPIDQYLARHPEFLFDKSPEQALINPNNLLLLLAHLKCAAFELPIFRNMPFGTLEWEKIEPIINVLEKLGFLHRSGDRYYWTADQYPAQEVSLRTIGDGPYRLYASEDGRNPHLIGEVDDKSAFWMIHPGAVYLHSGQSYIVSDLDLEHKTAQIKPFTLTYTTLPIQEASIESFSIESSNEVPGSVKVFGDISLNFSVTGYKKIDWDTQEILSVENLSLPITNLQTEGYWLTISQKTIENLAIAGLWRNNPNNYGPQWKSIRDAVRARDHYSCRICGKPESGRPHHVHHIAPFRSFKTIQEANQMSNLVTLCPDCHRAAELKVHIRSGLAGLSNLILGVAPLLVMSDQEDLGVLIDQDGVLDQTPSILIYDKVPAGIGLALSLYHLHSDLMSQAYSLVEECPCLDGCPSCVGPVSENGIGGKQETIALLSLLIETV
jgi:DEAD/DEAH box helicase domain-containing protein